MSILWCQVTYQSECCWRTIHLWPLSADVVRVTGPASARHQPGITGHWRVINVWWDDRHVTPGHVTRGVNQRRYSLRYWISAVISHTRDLGGVHQPTWACHTVTQLSPVSYLVSGQSLPTQWISRVSSSSLVFQMLGYNRFATEIHWLCRSWVVAEW